jgi:hypothetical protein
MKPQHEKRRLKIRSTVLSARPSGQPDHWILELNCGHTVIMRSIGKPDAWSFPCDSCARRANAGKPLFQRPPQRSA